MPLKKKILMYDKKYYLQDATLNRISLFFSILLSLFLTPFFLSTVGASDDYRLASARQMMVERDLKGRDIHDSKVLEIMLKIERHRFVDQNLESVAYADHPLPIDEGQTISQPYIIALMTQVLNLRPGEKVLEIGTGSGYQAAVLSELTPHVYTIEIRKKLTEKAGVLLKELGYKNVKVKAGDGYFGWEEYAPFDAIIVTCAANHIPPPLIKQLKEGGRLVIPLGSTSHYQTLTLIKKVKGELDVQHITGVAFVPMVGEIGKRR